MEWGGFNSHAVAGAVTSFDMQIDRDEDQGAQRFEKQISGRYLGEIARHVIVHLISSGVLLAADDVSPTTRAAAGKVFGVKHAFTTPMMSAIEASAHDEIVRQARSQKMSTSKFAEFYMGATDAERKSIRDGWVAKTAMDQVITLSAADSPAAFARQARMAQEFATLWMTASDADRAIITEVCRMVSTRAARLAAAAVVAVVRKTGRTSCTVAVDGSVFEKYPHFQADMEDAIEEMCGNGRALKLVHAEDGSGKGAALIAAIA